MYIELADIEIFPKIECLHSNRWYFCSIFSFLMEMEILTSISVRLHKHLGLLALLMYLKGWLYCMSYICPLYCQQLIFSLQDHLVSIIFPQLFWSSFCSFSHCKTFNTGGAEVASEATDFFHKIEESVESLEQAMTSILTDSQNNSSEPTMRRSVSSSSSASFQGNFSYVVFLLYCVHMLPSYHDYVVCKIFVF